MSFFHSLKTEVISVSPARLYHGMPAILLGTLFNVLDAGMEQLLLTEMTGILLIEVQCLRGS